MSGGPLKIHNLYTTTARSALDSRLRTRSARAETSFRSTTKNGRRTDRRPAAGRFSWESPEVRISRAMAPAGGATARAPDPAVLAAYWAEYEDLCRQLAAQHDEEDNHYEEDTNVLMEMRERSANIAAHTQSANTDEFLVNMKSSTSRYIDSFAESARNRRWRSGRLLNRWYETRFPVGIDYLDTPPPRRPPPRRSSAAFLRDQLGPELS
ncbi:hypothetical protein EVAR_83340_1 [Eumeta japonica]|uniref:Uncharacterized protein n=1 Tax=Eumeta variegata TaxID=151549 RepID=A0A4C1VVL8_EUMVA|nr:hypothetical protein EVAR_83340_1 [Eumeta japonica]